VSIPRVNRHHFTRHLLARLNVLQRGSRWIAVNHLGFAAAEVASYGGVPERRTLALWKSVPPAYVSC